MRQLNFAPSRTSPPAGLTHALRERWRGLRPVRTPRGPTCSVPAVPVAPAEPVDLAQRVRECGEW